MPDCILAMKTQTAAERARRAAVLERIPVQVVSVDPSVTRHGCALGLMLPCTETGRLMRVLDQKKIPYGDVIGRQM